MKERGFLGTKIFALVSAFAASTFFPGYKLPSIRHSTFTSALSLLMYLSFFALFIVYLFTSRDSFKRSIFLSLSLVALATESLCTMLSLLDGSYLWYVLPQQLILFFIFSAAAVFSFINIRHKAFVTLLLAAAFPCVNGVSSSLSVFFYGSPSFDIVFSLLARLSVGLFVLVFAIHLMPTSAPAATAPAVCPNCGTPIKENASFCVGCGTKFN